MASSQETFSKKEREKKRLKKKQDKIEKKEERQASAVKGQSLEDMMVYVDENGNLTSTPPDPRKKKTVRIEDIQLGVAKQDDIIPADLIREGIVSFFNESKGYGFIRDLKTQESVFVHVNALVEPIRENDKVTFEIEQTPKGSSAVSVRLK
ncbi:MAG: cold shock domain-containing protein [Spirosomataceae bacterium]